MAPSTDPRRTVGNKVHSRARLVVCESESKRYFGSLWKTKTVPGTVTKVDIRLVNGRNCTFLTIRFDLPNRQKECTLPLCSVKVGDGLLNSPQTDNVDTAIVPPLPAQNVDNQPNEGEQLQNLQEADPVSQAPPSDQSVTVHDRAWNTEAICSPINGCMQLQPWKVIGPAGDFISPRHCPSTMTFIDYFLWMFPIGHLKTIVEKTNKNLENDGASSTSGGELLRFFGVMVLISRLEFSNRRDLWGSKPASRFMSQPVIGEAMSRNRFQTLRRCICFSGNAAQEDYGTARWNLVTDFVKAINDHRRSFVTPSHALCVDESMSRWYGLGGDWIDVGLPHYTALDRKPENGLEMKTVCCGRSGIMLNIELNMGSEAPDQDFDTEHTHGTAILLRLVQPWFGSGRHVCADSFFASVKTANALLEKGLRFTGVIKNATRQFPMKHLSEKTLEKRGDFVSMVSKGNGLNTDLMAVMWVDRERRYFISTCNTVNPGNPIMRQRWRRQENVSRKVELEVPIPEVCEEYHKTCSMIDRHNRCRQDELKLEKKIEVKDWSFRVNSSLLSICMVDAWMLYKAGNGMRKLLSPYNFYSKLADELITNTWDRTALMTRDEEHMEIEDDIPKPAGTGVHLMQTNRKRKTKDGMITKSSYQGRCKVCKGNMKSKCLCSECYISLKSEVYLCHTGTGRDCFKNHIELRHGVKK